MPDLRRRNCQRCAGHMKDVGPISWKGLCETCATARVAENIIGLSTYSGEPFHRWRKAMAASVGGVLLDEQPRGE